MMSNCFISIFISQFGEFNVWFAPTASKSKARALCGQLNGGLKMDTFKSMTILSSKLCILKSMQILVNSVPPKKIFH